MRISLFNPFSNQYSALNDFPKLTTSQKITVIVLTILSALATIFVLGIALVAVFRTLVEKYKITNQHKSLIPVDKIPFKPSPQEIKPVLCEIPLVLPPFFPKPSIIKAPDFDPEKDSKTNWDTRGVFFKYHFSKILASQRKGIAHSADKGDCFFDSVAQTLTVLLQKQITLKDVRLKVKEYIDDLDKKQPNNWIKQELAGNQEGSYQSIKDNVALTRSECDSPIWGNKTIAKIIARVYAIKLKLYSLGTYELDIPSTKSLEKDKICMIYKSTGTAEVLFTEDDEIFGIGEKLIEIACYTAGPDGHFYPIFDL